jgi:hypothetical protein
MKKMSYVMRGVLLGAMLSSGFLVVSSQDATAATSSIDDPYPDPVLQSYDISGRARYGGTGFEGILFTPGPDPNMLPSGAPVWDPSFYYGFALNYVVATGTTTWSIDFNRDGDFLDAAESVSSLSPTLVGKTFNYANLYLQGNTTAGGTSAANVDNFTVNGRNFGSYSSSPPTGLNYTTEAWFADDSGLFGSVINITGRLNLTWTGTGATADEIPRMWVRLDDAEQLPVVPVPAAAGLGFLGMGLVGFLRRRKNAKA